jgi:hypothetical protein
LRTFLLSLLFWGVVSTEGRKEKEKVDVTERYKLWRRDRGII